MSITSHIQSRIRNTKRLAEVLTVLGRYGFAELVIETGADRLLEKGRSLLGRPATPPDEQLTEYQRIRMVLEALGPVFVKLGQILSTRPDLIPADLADEFRHLQSDAPKVPYERIRERLDTELNGAVDELFESIDEEPLAAASMAQAHCAVLKDGSPVVIKVLRPGIESIIESDMEILQELARFAERHFDNQGFSPTDVVEEFAKELAKEIDFRLEARSTDRLRRLFEDDPAVSFPSVYRRQSSQRVLTLERIEGRLLSRVQPDELPRETRRAIVVNGAEAVFRMCLEYCFFHADPHPGNIIVLDGGRICFIDCGMTGNVEQRTARELARFVQGAVAHDVDEVIRMVVELTSADPALEFDRKFRNDVSELISGIQVEEGSLEDLRLGDLLRGLFELLRRWRIRCPSDVVFLLKALMTIEGVGRRLDPEFDLVGHARPMLQRRIMSQYSPGAIRDRLVRGAAAYIDVIEDLPAELRALLALLRRKDFAINLRHEELDRLAGSIDRASRTMVYGMIIASAILGSSILILADSSRAEAGPLTKIGFAGLAAVALFAAVFGWINYRKGRWKRKR
jgi:ubiquinone biosynthesis protein